MRVSPRGASTGRMSGGLMVLLAASFMTFEPLADSQVVQQTQRPVFKGRLDLVRTEVSVIANGSGKPVTGLEVADFSVFENDVRQEIASFVPLSSPDHSDGRTSTRRVFLIIFGSGPLPGPVRPHDGAIDFLLTRVRPTDVSAVMVWNKVTALTTDHRRVADVVDRVRKLPGAVFDSIQRDMFRRVDMSAETQAAIDQWLSPLENSDGFLRNATTLLIGTSQYQREVVDGYAWNRRLAGSDLLKVYAGVEYLRHIEGQKHLILLSRYGMYSGAWPTDPTGFLRSADDRQAAIYANDAGVALDIIHTFGTQPSSAVPGFSSSYGVEQQASQVTARESGGQFTSVRTASEGLARIDAATRNAYLVGYVPTDPNMDGRYRRVEIRVNRKDVTVVHRRGYTARADPPPVDPRELLARIRLRTAAESTLQSSVRLDDIKVTVTAAVTKGSTPQARVGVTIDPTGLSLTRADDRWVGRIELMILLSDANARVVGGLNQRMDLNMPQALYDQARATGIPYSSDLGVTGVPKNVKVIVYDYETDRLGVAVATVK